MRLWIRFSDVLNITVLRLLILALVMCLSLIPITAFTYGNEWIQLDKSNYDPGEEINVTVSGVNAQWLDNWAKVGVFLKGSAPSSYGKEF